MRHQLAVAKRSTRISQARVAQRLRVLYEQDEVEPLEIVLGSTSLDEAMTNLDDLNRSTGQGQDILRELAGARKGDRPRLTRARRAYGGSHSRNTRRGGDGRVSRSDTRTEKLVHRVAGVAAQADGTADLDISRNGKRSTAAQLAGRARRYGSRHRCTEAATLTVSATGYSLQGNTASGLPVGWGIVAVDPSVIPLGTHMTIPGYGDAVAADMGGSIVGDDDRPLVPDRRPGQCLGPSHRDDRVALAPARLH